MRSHNKYRLLMFILVVLLTIQAPLGSINATSTIHPKLKWQVTRIANYYEADMVEDNKSILAYACDQSHGTPDTVAWLYNASTGDLIWQVRVHFWGANVEPMDLDNDGKVDLIITMFGHDWYPTEVQVFRDRATTPSADHNWTDYASFIEAQDITGDGVKDLFFLTSWPPPAGDDRPNYTLEARNGKDLSLIWSFNLKQRYGGDEVDASIARWMDLNGDGVPDPVLDYSVIDWSPYNVTSSGLDVLDGRNGQSLKLLEVDGYIDDYVFLRPSSKTDLSSHVLWSTLTSPVGPNSTWTDRLSTFDANWDTLSIKPMSANVTVYGMTRFVEMAPGKPGLLHITNGTIKDDYIAQFYSVPELLPLWNITLQKITGYPYVEVLTDLNHNGYNEVDYVNKGLWLYSGNGSGLIRYIPFNDTNEWGDVIEGNVAVINFDATNRAPCWLWVYDLTTGERILTFNGTDEMRSVYLSDVDGDKNPELLMATENLSMTHSNSAWGIIAVYDLDPGSGGGGGGNGGDDHNKKTPTRVKTALDDPFSLLLLVIMIASICAVLFYEYRSWKRSIDVPPEKQRPPTSAGPSHRISDRSAPGVSRRFPPVS